VLSFIVHGGISVTHTYNLHSRPMCN